MVQSIGGRNNSAIKENKAFFFLFLFLFFVSFLSFIFFSPFQKKKTTQICFFNNSQPGQRSVTMLEYYGFKEH